MKQMLEEIAVAVLTVERALPPIDVNVGRLAGLHHGDQLVELAEQPGASYVRNQDHRILLGPSYPILVAGVFACSNASRCSSSARPLAQIARKWPGTVTLCGVCAVKGDCPLSAGRFRIETSFLTDPGDTVLDVFAGSNTTGEAAEELDRRWIGVESNRDYAIASAFRFMADWPAKRIRNFVDRARSRRE